MVIVEKRKTATICYQILANFPGTNNKHGEEIVEELHLLMEQSILLHPEISAMGLFVPNRKLMLGMASFGTSHIIVLLLVHYDYSMLSM